MCLAGRGDHARAGQLCLARHDAGTYGVSVLPQLDGEAPGIPGVLLSRFMGVVLPQHFDPAVPQFPLLDD